MSWKRKHPKGNGSTFLETNTLLEHQNLQINRYIMNKYRGISTLTLIQATRLAPLGFLWLAPALVSTFPTVLPTSPTNFPGSDGTAASRSVSLIHPGKSTYHGLHSSHASRCSKIDPESCRRPRQAKSTYSAFQLEWASL